jgi:hypothetical protein
MLIRLASARDPDKDENPSECGQQRVAEAVSCSPTRERKRFEALLITAYLDFIAALFIHWRCRWIYLETSSPDA